MIAITTRQITRNNSRIAGAIGLSFAASGQPVAQVARPQLTCALILLGTFAVMTLAKAALIALMGAEAYGASLVVMQDGGMVDRAAAMLMAVDGATKALTDLMV